MDKRDIIICSVDAENIFERLTKRPTPSFCQVCFWIAPKHPLYLADELNSFMEDLIPGLEPYGKADFKQDIENSKDCFLELGDLYYREKVGTEKKIRKTTYEITDDELMNVGKIVNGKYVLEEGCEGDLGRDIVIRPFPNKYLVQLGREDCINGKDYHPGIKRMARWNYIHLDDIKKYEPNIEKILKKNAA